MGKQIRHKLANLAVAGRKDCSFRVIVRGKAGGNLKFSSLVQAQRAAKRLSKGPGVDKVLIRVRCDNDFFQHQRCVRGKCKVTGSGFLD